MTTQVNSTVLGTLGNLSVTGNISANSYVGGSVNVTGNVLAARGNLGTLSVTGNITSTGSIIQNGVTGGIIPVGGIIMWSGNIVSIPTSWALCNGSNGTPDLRNRFIIGASADSGGQANTTVTGSTTKTGGTANAIVVSHTHTATVTDPGHSHTQVVSGYDTDTGNGGAKGTHPVGSIYAYNTSGVGLQQNSSKNTQPSTTGITVSNSTEGSSGTNANLPPYYALAFIMRIN
jgi:hypothetical protein